jgi:hypothetical protein
LTLSCVPSRRFGSLWLMPLQPCGLVVPIALAHAGCIIFQFAHAACDFTANAKGEVRRRTRSTNRESTKWQHTNSASVGAIAYASIWERNPSGYLRNVAQVTGNVSDLTSSPSWPWHFGHFIHWIIIVDNGVVEADRPHVVAALRPATWLYAIGPKMNVCMCLVFGSLLSCV